VRTLLTRLRDTDDLTRIAVALALLIGLAAVVVLDAGPATILSGVSNGVDLPTPVR
jgi:hypothetical protein